MWASGGLATLVLASAVAAVGVGATASCLPAAVLAAVPAARAGEAAGSNSLSRGIGSALGVEMSALVLGGAADPLAGYAMVFALAALAAAATAVAAV